MFRTAVYNNFDAEANDDLLVLSVQQSCHAVIGVVCEFSRREPDGLMTRSMAWEEVAYSKAVAALDD